MRPTARRTPRSTTPTKIAFSAPTIISRVASSPSRAHGRKATLRRRWLSYSAGPMRLTILCPNLQRRRNSSKSKTRSLDASSGEARGWTELSSFQSSFFCKSDLRSGGRFKAMATPRQLPTHVQPLLCASVESELSVRSLSGQRTREAYLHSC